MKHLILLIGLFLATCLNAQDHITPLQAAHLLVEVNETSGSGYYLTNFYEFRPNNDHYGHETLYLQEGTEYLYYLVTSNIPGQDPQLSMNMVNKATKDCFGGPEGERFQIVKEGEVVWFTTDNVKGESAKEPASLRDAGILTIGIKSFDIYDCVVGDYNLNYHFKTNEHYNGYILVFKNFGKEYAPAADKIKKLPPLSSQPVVEPKKNTGIEYEVTYFKRFGEDGKTGYGYLNFGNIYEKKGAFLFEDENGAIEIGKYDYLFKKVNRVSWWIKFKPKDIPGNYELTDWYYNGKILNTRVKPIELNFTGVGLKVKQDDEEAHDWYAGGKLFYEVTYVSPESEAYGKINVGDRISRIEFGKKVYLKFQPNPDKDWYENHWRIFKALTGNFMDYKKVHFVVDRNGAEETVVVKTVPLSFEELKKADLSHFFGKDLYDTRY